MKTLYGTYLLILFCLAAMPTDNSVRLSGQKATILEKPLAKSNEAMVVQHCCDGINTVPKAVNWQDSAKLARNRLERKITVSAKQLKKIKKAKTTKK